MQIHVHVIVVLSRLVVVKQECFSLGFFFGVCVLSLSFILLINI